VCVLCVCVVCACCVCECVCVSVCEFLIWAPALEALILGGFVGRHCCE
jgi:hypothetical protein